MINLDWESKRKIEEVIDQLAMSRVKRFYPTVIHKITKIPLDEAFNYLLILVGDKRLILKWEIKCPNLNCNSIIERTEEIEEFLNKEIECPYCAEEVSIRKSIVFPVFEFNERYRSKIKEIKKKDINLLKAL